LFIRIFETCLLLTKGLISKEDFAAALRGHQAAVNATKSPARETAEAYYQMKKKKKRQS
jgi:hypothetical protein